jgi:predicted dehydrogenase
MNTDEHGLDWHRFMTRRSWLAGIPVAAQTLRAAEVLRLPRKVRIALIGVEGHTGEVLNHLREAPDVELVAVADSDPKQTARIARGPLDSARQYSDWRRLLDGEKLDIAVVCGPNGTRAEIILACVARGLHIVAEKPLAIERAGLEQIRAAVGRQGVRLTMLLPMRFASPYLAIKRVVEAGAIGEVAQISAQKSYKLEERPEWMRHRATFGGTIPYIGIHMVDLMRWSSGREMVEAVSFQGRIGHPEMADMENTTATIFRLDNGGTATLHMDYLRPETAPTHGDDRLRLAGPEGIVEYQDDRGVTLVTGKEKPHAITDLPPGRSLFLDFLASVYRGAPAGLSMADIWRVNEIVLAARESAEQHRMVGI